MIQNAISDQSESKWLENVFSKGLRPGAAPWWSWCLQATWKVSQEPFFDSRLIVETSALFIAASFRIRHLDQISGPEVADNSGLLMRMQLSTFEMRFYKTWSCPKYGGIFRHPCLDSTQFLGLRETCEFRFSIWMRCQPNWSNLSQLNRFGFRAGQPWLQMFNPTGPEWFVRFIPPLLTLTFLLQFDQHHAWHICGGREMHVVKPCKTVHWPFLYMSKQKRFGNQRHVRVVRVARQPAQGWKAWGKVEGRAEASNLWHRWPVYGGLSTICHVFNASKSKVGQTTICLPCLPLREHRKHERGNFVTCFQERLSGPGE